MRACAPPYSFVNKPYALLFDHLVSRNVMALGVRRGILTKIGMGRGGNKLPFVFTNPPGDAVVFDCDSVYCLALEDPGDKEAEAGRKERERKQRKMTSIDVKDMLDKARQARVQRENNMSGFRDRRSGKLISESMDKR